MRLGFDAKRALNNASGLGNYSRNLLNALMRDFPDNEYLLFSPKAQDEFFHQLNGDFKMVFPETKFQKSLHPLWRSFGIKSQLFKNRIDLYHGLSNEIPFGLRTSDLGLVVTIHDLVFLKHKEQYSFIDRQVYDFKTRYAARCANKIIAVSQETKDDLIKYYGVAPERIVVIPPPVDNAFQNPAPGIPFSEIASKYGLSGKYILHVGSFFPRKNQKTLVQAFSLIKDKVQEDLVLVGGIGGTRKEIEALIASKGLQQRVKIVPGVSNEDLPAIYRSASVFVYPSLYEGFGMPVVEALFSKVPVIATKGGCFEEAGGKDSIYVNPTSPDEIAEALLKVLGDSCLRKRMIFDGWQHAETMSDKIIAEKTMKVYRQVLEV